MSELRLDGGCLDGGCLDGGCACGAIRFECRSKILNAYKCHCRDCQRSSGSGYVGILWVYDEDVRLTRGEPTYFAVSPGPGRELRRGFCRECGSNVFAKNTVAPPLLFLIASALDDPTLFRPRLEIWTGSAPPWDLVDRTLPVFEGQPSRAEMLRVATF